jgi:hypothetical protein
MTAVVGGSITFVAEDIPPFEVREMYAIRLDADLKARTNSAVREYARLEYTTEDVGWILAAIRRSAAMSKPRRAWPFGLRLRTHPSHMPVAHKGHPALDRPAGT